MDFSGELAAVIGTFIFCRQGMYGSCSSYPCHRLPLVATLLLHRFIKVMVRCFLIFLCIDLLLFLVSNIVLFYTLFIKRL
jgi:hypothetical protein